MGPGTPMNERGRRLVGRATLVRALEAAVDDAVAGRSRLVLLAGEPGIGKTTLAGHAAAYAQRLGGRAAWGTCWDGDGAPGFWPWRQVLKALAQAGAVESSESLAPLIGSPAVDMGPARQREERFRTFVAVTEALAAAAAAAPLVVVLDDLHWADAASLRLLAFVARHVRDARLLVVGAYRDLDPPPPGELRVLLGDLAGRAETFAVSGLTLAETGALLVDVAGGLPADVAAAVHARTGGNPFFVQETGRLLAAGGAPVVPVAVGETIARRVGWLPDKVVDVLRTAAVLGARFEVGTLARATGRSDVEIASALERGVGIRVMRADGPATFRFEHDLFREALAAQLDPVARAQTHGRVGRALESRGAANAELAFHFGQSTADDVERAVRYARAAASDASATLAHEEATRLRRQVIRLGAATPEAYLELADAARQSGEHAESQTAYQQAATAPELIGRAALGLHELGSASSASHRAVIDLLERALSGPPDPLRPRLLAALARELADGPDKDEQRARSLADAAIDAARRDDPASLAFCLFAKHDVIWAPGTAAQRLAVAGEMAAAAGDDLEMAFQAQMCRFIALVDLGDPSSGVALRDLDRVAQLSRRPKHRYLVVSREAAIAMLEGRYAEALRAIEDADSLGDMIGEPDTHGVRMTQLLVLALTREGPGGAKRLWNEVGYFAPDEFEPETRALIRTADGDALGGAAILRASVPALRRAWFRWRALSALAFDVEVIVAAGALDLARRAYDDLSPYRGEIIGIGGASAVLAPVSLYLGLLAAAMGEHARAAEDLTDALEVARRLGARPLASRAGAELGLALLAQGVDTAQADRLLRDAEETARELGLVPVLERLRDRATRGDNRFHRDGAMWTLGFAGRTAHVADAKGLHDLAALLAAPGTDVPATVLLSGTSAGEGVALFGSDEVIDAEARRAYQARLERIDSELDRAALHDRHEAVRRLTAEREALIAELTHAYGLGGRPRRLGDAGEKARTTVTARIRGTLRRIEEVHPELGAHLRESVTTGRSCSYRPRVPTRWSL